MQRTNLYRKVRHGHRPPGPGNHETSSAKIVGLLHRPRASWPPSPAEAQIIAPREAAQIEFGSVSIYPSLRLVDVGLDENVYNDAVNAKEDYTFTIASKALTVWRLGLNELMFSAGSDYVWFKENASQRSTNANYGLRFNLSASRFKPFIGAERVQTRTRPNVEIDTRARRLDHQIVAGANFNISERTAISTNAEYTDSRYDDGEQFRGVELDDALNHASQTYSGGVRYTVTPLTTFAVMAIHPGHVHRLASAGLESYSVTPVGEFPPMRQYADLLAGVELFSPEDPRSPTPRGDSRRRAHWSIFRWGRCLT